MRRLLFMLLLLCLTVAGLPARAATGEEESFSLSPEEFAERYGRAGEEISAETANELLLELVNTERRRLRIGSLKWHETAAELSSEQAGQLARTGACSHYGEDGAKCELRFNRLNESDHVTENVFLAILSRQPYLTRDTVRYVHSAWMESRSHRANLLDPHHTHMGCAFSIRKSMAGEWNFGAVQEFVRSYGSYHQLPLTQPRGARLQITGELNPAEVRFAFVGIGHEELPSRKSYQAALQRPCVYSSPSPLIAYAAEDSSFLVPGLPRTVIRRVESDPESGGFSLFIETAEHWDPGAYYFTVWAESLNKPGELFCAMTQVVLLD